MEATNQPTVNTTNNPNDLFDQQTKGLPGMLNALTILTFIGCGLSYLSAIWSFFKSADPEKQRAEIEAAQDSMGDSELGNRVMQESLDMIQKTYDNRYILLISALLFTTLCLIGAMQMRKLKKSGYMLYVIGELAPIVITAVLIGFSLVGGIALVLGSIFAVVFVILYSTQRKYLVN